MAPLFRRVRVLSQVLTAGLFISVGVAVAQPASAATPTIENLGVPMRSVSIRSAAVGVLPNGTPAVFAVSAGSPVQFNVLNARTGELIASHAVAPFTLSFDTEIAPDGSVYFEVQGAPDGAPALMHYLPGSDTLLNLGNPVPGEKVINRVTFAPDGTVYGGTYPNAHVFRYSPSTGKFADLGSVAAGETYVRSIAYGRGVLYVGTGTSARLFAIDLATGVKREIPLPEPNASKDLFVYRMAFRQGLLFVFNSPSLDWLVYDTQTQTWIDRIANNGEGGITDVGPNHLAYFVNNATQDLYSYDVKQHVASVTGFNDGTLTYNSTRAIGLAALGGSEWPGLSVVGVGIDGSIWQWNPVTGQKRRLVGHPLGGAVTIHTIGRGPDGNMYIGGFFTVGTMARFNTTTDSSEQLPGPTQIEGFGIYQGDLYLGTYSDGGVVRYDDTKPWQYGTNPQTLFTLAASHQQERPFAFADAGDRLAVGTVGMKDTLDGSLTFYTPATGQVDDTGPPIPNQSVTALATLGDSTLIGGTSSQQLGVPPVDPQAKIFLWDLNTDTVTWSGAPVPGATDISELTVDGDGNVWGITSNATVFEFDPTTHQVLHTVQIVDPARVTKDIWGIGSLFFGPDGKLYGSSGGWIFSLDPNTLTPTVLDSGQFAAMDNAGRIYYAQGETLLRLTP